MERMDRLSIRPTKANQPKPEWVLFKMELNPDKPRIEVLDQQIKCLRGA